MFHCFKFSAHIRFFFSVLIERNVNISHEFNFSDGLLKYKLHWVTGKVYMNISGSFTLPTILCSLLSINFRKMKFIP